MLYNPPTGGAANDPYVGKNVAAGTQGSKVPPAAIESVQREIVAVITAAGLNPTNADWQQLLRVIRSGVTEYYLDAGAVNAPAISPSPAHTSLVDGLHVRVRMKAAPTGPTNLAINAFGAPVQRIGGGALTGGEWAANDVVDLVYNAARSAFQIMGVNAIAPTALWHLVIDASTNAAAIAANPPATTPAVPTRIADLAYLVIPANACAGATTINVGFGAQPLTRNDGSALQAGDYLASQPLIAIDDGTKFRIVDLTPSQVIALIIANQQKILTAAPSISPPKNGRFIKTAGTYVLTVGGNGANDPPATVTDVLVTGMGGGGGGASTGTNYSGGGGGSGGPVSDWIRGLAPGNTITLVVGAGGVGSTPGDNKSAGYGGASTCVAHPTNGAAVSLTSTGGGGGLSGPNSTAGGPPGQGSGSSINYNLLGASGADGNLFNNQIQGGNGGASIFGGGGRTSTIGPNNGSTASNGQAPGSGGGGIWSNNNPGTQNGGNGADGGWFIQW